jgi:predicted lactoylglutathione lyase
MLRAMDQRISLITLGYRDYERARDFYAAIGWTNAISPDDEVVFFQAGGMIFALWDRAKLAEDSCVQDAGGWGGITVAYNVGSPEEVDEVLAGAEAAGGSVPREGAKTPWGGYSGVFIDPEGHPWEVAHNPGWTLHDDGTISLS